MLVAINGTPGSCTRKRSSGAASVTLLWYDGQDPTPKGGGVPPPPPLQTPKWLYRTMGFVGAGDFDLGIWQGEIFLFDPMCLYSKYSEFCGEFKNG